MDERDPVEPSEFVYRRIHATYFDAAVMLPVRPEAFRPNENDTMGLSVFRAGFTQPYDTLLNIEPAKAKLYYVCKLAVGDLLNLSLTVQPDPILGGPLGHALIPEITWVAYHAQKRRWKPVLVELAKLASADIVLKPA